MKVKLGKKEYNNKGGFALLFSVLVSSLLLTIGLSIFSIALKELAISTATRQSIHAFYAADSGLECANYWDLKRGQLPNLLGQESGSIKCGNMQSSVNVIGSYSSNPPSSATSVGMEISKIFITGNSGPNFNVEIKKEKSNGSICTQLICTTITSFGHDTDSGDKIERAIEQSY
jgi:hypothetical protein